MTTIKNLWEAFTMLFFLAVTTKTTSYAKIRTEIILHLDYPCITDVKCPYPLNRVVLLLFLRLPECNQLKEKYVLKNHTREDREKLEHMITQQLIAPYPLSEKGWDVVKLFGCHFKSVPRSHKYHAGIFFLLLHDVLSDFLLGRRQVCRVSLSHSSVA